MPLAPGLVRVVAPNPSPMTFWGTNCYLLGEAEVCVIDPGPADPAHLAALRAAIAGRRVTAIVVTHAHLDHAPLARPLAQVTGAEILAFGPASAGRSPAMTRLAKRGRLGGGEGVDSAFRPDRTLSDGDIVTGSGWSLRALHTPGHMGGHLCLAWGEQVFSGDHVMGWASSLVSPPDGDLTAFMVSLERLRQEQARILHPGHGAPVADPAARIDRLIAHRRRREAQILEALDAGPARPAELVHRIYTDTPAALWPAAARNLLAHLLDLEGKGRVTALPEPALDALFFLR